MKNYTYEMVQAEMAFKDLFGTKELIEARKYYFASESLKIDYITFLKQETERKLKANECDKNLDCKNCKSKVSCEEETIYRKDIEEDDDFI